MRFPEFEGEWEEKRLEDICKMQAGNFISASEINEKFENGLFPCYGGNGLRGYTKSFNYSGPYSLIGRQGALCGNVKFVEGQFYATEHAVVVLPNDGIDTRWMFYLLGSLNLNQYATGMAQPGLSVQNLQKVEALIPNSEKEQKRISSFLYMVDQRIQTQNKIIEQLETLMQNLREKLFKREFRFKDKKGAIFPSWQLKSLATVASKKSSNISASKIENNFGEFIIYGASGILKYIDFYEEEDDYVSIIKDGAGVGRLSYCKGKSSVLGTMEIIKPKRELIAYFLYCLLNNIDFKKYITGSTIPHIYFKDYSNESCLIPCMEEQIAISKFLLCINAKIEIERKTLKKYEFQKQYLSKNLFI